MTYRLKVTGRADGLIWSNFLSEIRSRHDNKYTTWSIIHPELKRYGARDVYNTDDIEFDREEDRTWFLLRFS